MSVTGSIEPDGRAAPESQARDPRPMRWPALIVALLVGAGVAGAVAFEAEIAREMTGLLSASDRAVTTAVGFLAGSLGSVGWFARRDPLRPETQGIRASLGDASGAALLVCALVTLVFEVVIFGPLDDSGDLLTWVLFFAVASVQAIPIAIALALLVRLAGRRWRAG